MLLAACPREMTFLGKTIEVWSVNVDGDDYQHCLEAAPRLWSSHKTGRYGRGLNSTTQDPARTMRIGLLGEAAFALAFGCHIDVTYRQGGDQHDFLLGDGLSVNVKTKGYWCNPDRCHVRAIDGNGRLCPPSQDVFVFACLDTTNRLHDDRQRGCADVILAGWLTRGELLCCPLAPSRSGGPCQNLEVYFNNLRSMESLVPFLDGTLGRTDLEEDDARCARP